MQLVQQLLHLLRQSLVVVCLGCMVSQGGGHKGVVLMAMAAVRGTAQEEQRLDKPAFTGAHVKNEALILWLEESYL